MERTINLDFSSRFNPKHPLLEQNIFPANAFFSTLGKMPTCFIKDTKILLEDGSWKRIDLLTAATPAAPDSGDKVLSVDGTPSYIVGLYAGIVDEPIISITVRTLAQEFPDKKFELRVTPGHTINVDLSRLVHAYFIKTGDRVSTIYGRAIVEEVKKIDYEKDVWNLFLSSKTFVSNVLPGLTPERLYYHLFNSSLGLTPKQHLIFGEGILSGDLYLQVQTAEFAELGYSLVNFV